MAQHPGEAARLVGRVAVGRHLRDAHTQTLVVAQGTQQGDARGPARLAGERLVEAYAQVVIDGHTQGLPACARRVASVVTRSMLGIHYQQQWFALSDPAMEEALQDMLIFREFDRLDDVARLPDETTILRFRHLLERHDLATDMLRVVNDLLQANGLMMKKGTAADATLIAAPNATRAAMHSASSSHEPKPDRPQGFAEVWEPRGLRSTLRTTLDTIPVGWRAQGMTFCGPNWLHLVVKRSTPGVIEAPVVGPEMAIAVDGNVDERLCAR